MVLLTVNLSPQAGSTSVHDWMFPVPAQEFLPNATPPFADPLLYWAVSHSRCDCQRQPGSCRVGNAVRVLHSSPAGSVPGCLSSSGHAAQLFSSPALVAPPCRCAPQGCTAVKTCASSWTHSCFTFFLSLAGYIFKGHRCTEWNTSILPIAALGRRSVISLWGRGGEGRAANFPCRSGTAWERKCRGKRRKIT